MRCVTPWSRSSQIDLAGILSVSTRVIALSSSPRRGSNSSRLLDEAVAGAEEGGASVRVVDLAREGVKPCVACDGCIETGRCVVTSDALNEIMDEVTSAGRMIVAAPIYYMGPPAQLKAFVDRAQCRYNLKYRVGKRLGRDELGRRAGGTIAVCGSRVRRAFDGFDFVMKYFMDSLQIPHRERLYVGGIDGRGDVEAYPERLAEARALGRRVALQGASPEV